MNLFNLWILLQVWCSLVPLTAAEAPEPNPSAPPDLDPSPSLEPDSSLPQDPDASPSPNPALVPQPVPVPNLIQDTELFLLPLVPLGMQWIGSIGGLLGVISFADTYIGKLIDAFSGSSSHTPRPPAKHDTAWFKHLEDYHRKIWTGWKTRVAPEKKGEPSWKVGIQVGLDGSGLQVQ